MAMTKRQCTAEAKALAARLGPNWKPHVWENLGWHYCAELEATKTEEGTHRHAVHPHVNGSYWADLRIAGTQFHAEGPTPRAALRFALAQAQAIANDLGHVRFVTRVNQ